MTKCFAGDTQTVSSETAMVFTDSSKSKSLFVRLRALFRGLFRVGYGTLNGIFLQRDFGNLDDIFLFWALCAVLPSACTARAPQRPRGFFGPSSVCPDLLGWWVKYLGGRFCIIPASCKGMIIFSLQHSLKCLLIFSRSLQEWFSSLLEGHSKLFFYTTL